MRFVAAIVAILWPLPAMSDDAVTHEDKQWTRAALKALAARVAVEENVSPSLFNALISVESGYQITAVSSKGAMSLAQLMPGTAQELGLSPDQFFEPEYNLRAGARYFKQQLDASGDIAVALAAYNAGMSRVKGRPRTEWPAETRDYVRDVLALAKLPGRKIGSIVSMNRAIEPPDGPKRPDPHSHMTSAPSSDAATRQIQSLTAEKLGGQSITNQGAGS